MKKDELLALAPQMGAAFGTLGSALGGNVPSLTGAGKSVADTGYEYARNLEYQIMLKEQEEEEKKKKKGKMGGILGSLAGAALGLIPGVGPLAAAGLSAAGGIAGGSVGEGKFIGPERALKEHVAPAAMSFGMGKLGGKLMSSLGGGNLGPVNPASARFKIGQLMSNPLTNAAITRGLTGGTPYGALTTGLLSGEDTLSSLLGLGLLGGY